ncbi:RHS repeat-associated core domain-containing protein [Persicobacter diffluens]|uniref:RHS repeat-associated core domain-containing protein n=1 Tax=Persicobacter diffluens TaxID=981 RepID=A0AAN5ANP9_9BACT|nr:hypothetical protein PEDI_55740 [Persicobacter diffluens]
MFNGKELDDETGLYYYGARYYDPRSSVWLSVDPLGEERSWLSPFNYCQNNPIIRIDPDGMLDNIEIKGENNSSITLKTDLIDVSVDASKFVGDFGGNYVFEGEDLLVAALDIVGTVDPTPTADVLSASIEAKNGNYGSAALSGLGVIPYIGNVGKLGKISKHTKSFKKSDQWNQ